MRKFELLVRTQKDLNKTLIRPQKNLKELKKSSETAQKASKNLKETLPECEVEQGVKQGRGIDGPFHNGLVGLSQG